jgi:hypothetical protein
METGMAAEIASGTLPHYEDEYVEFAADINGARQAFRVDGTVFEEMLHISGIKKATIGDLFIADTEHFLYIAARKYAKDGTSVEPIVITRDDLMS